MSDNDKRVIAEGKFLRMVKRGRWEWVERTNTSGAAVLVAVTDDRKLLLVEQFREPIGKVCVELPAGLVGDDEGHAKEEVAAAAGRELREETGFEARELEVVAGGAPSAGMGSELVDIVIARGLRRVSSELGDGHEQITLHEAPMERIDAWLAERVAEGKVLDVKIFAGLYFVMRRGLWRK
jgi:ADP-ribose pyrophosphatase